MGNNVDVILGGPVEAQQNAQPDMLLFFARFYKWTTIREKISRIVIPHE